MSEFSESYHLRSANADDAIQLLQRAKRKGFVYKSSNGWVTFLAEEGVFEPDKQIVAAANLPLLHYVSAEDHGWSFTLFSGGEIASAYRCDWEDSITVDDSKYSRAALEELVPSLNSEELSQLEPKLHPADFDELFEVEPSKLLAKALGLEHYDWLSYDYLESSFPTSPHEFPDVTEVQ